MEFYDFYSLIYIILGTVFGLFFGAIPGLTSTAAVALLIPMTYGINPYHGIGLLIGAFCGGTAGGAISAALLNIPGTPSSICTTFDAHPMVKNGRAGLALGTAMMSSLIGGLFSALFLIFLSPFIAEVALEFGPLEYLFLVMIGLFLSVRIVKESKTKAAISLAIGMLLSLVGTDSITGVSRLTFGNLNLRSGIGLVPLMVGFFAISQVLIDVEKSTAKTKTSMLEKQNISIVRFPKVKDWLSRWKVLCLSCFTGCFIGALPGAGGSMASISAYTFSQRVSKNADKYGSGEIDGVIASESSNNAMTGGALITTLALGIPGDTCTAVMLGGMKLLGVNTGPSLFVGNWKMVISLFMTFIIANIAMFLLQIVGMRFFTKVLDIPKYVMNSLIVIFSTIGIYCVRHNYSDLFVMLVMGLLGYFLLKFGFGIIPCLMGFIMGAMAEKHLRTAVTMYDSITDIFSRPIACGLACMVLFILFSFFVRRQENG